MSTETRGTPNTIHQQSESGTLNKVAIEFDSGPKSLGEGANSHTETSKSQDNSTVCR